MTVLDDIAPADLLAPALMHPIGRVRVAPPQVADPDPDTPETRQAVERVVLAYRRANQHAPEAPAPSMWDAITGTHAAFLAAVRSGCCEAVQMTLCRLLQTPLAHWVGRMHPDAPAQMTRYPASGPQIQVTDALVSLAEAVGVRTIRSIEQEGRAGYLRALDVDLARALDDVSAYAQLDPTQPAVAGAHGCQVGERFVSIDSLIHAYHVYRLRQLGAAPTARVVEIGGGYGALAASAAQNGYQRWSVVDLPWVNVLQGYYLLQALGPSRVSLYGEGPEAGIRVLPYWCFETMADRSVDVVVNTDSLPEMGAETARAYLAEIARLLVPGGLFFSVNQESQAPNVDVGTQNWVAALAREQPRLTLAHRARSWTRQGYVEEVWRARE